MAKTPLWKAIAEALKADIAEQKLRAGAKLPTEAVLAERFGVNRHTVRHAIASLVESGLVRTRRGAGAFVAAKLTDYPIGKRVRFHQNMVAAGQAPQKQQLDVERRGATEEEAEALMLQPMNPVCVFHGLSLADGHPLALFTSIFPEDRLPGIENALRLESSITKALQRCGVSDYTRASTRVTSRLATATQALHLHLNEGAALIYATGINVDEAGTPVEYGKTFFAGDRVTLTLEADV